ncbi:DUF58 domain-containing protein [Azoarcus olearius]|uniref:Conserved hypothetical membrane protein n=1 Tax=Azoarcus sp. (strain BH72) TaxID=418699 RepID=A1K4F5_AZOSB|nr:DUF58 domain-containing protein [Azoarcus olearius]CAL93710.1 conserved hypothetical membrane protein [Azoarcus olearius]
MPRFTPARIRARVEHWLFRIGAPEQAPIRLGQRRIYVLPTPAGLVFAAALVTMLIASINYGLSLGYMLTFLLASAGITSIVHAFRNLLHLEIAPARVTPVFCGEAAEFRLRINNARAERRPALRLRARGANTAFDAAAASATEIVLACRTTRRGLLELGRTVLETTWPLGLIRAWSIFVPDIDCIVYPAPEHHPPPLPAEGAGNEGGTRSSIRGDDDFAGLRPTQPSDSPRHIAWKSLARGGPMLTKQFSASTGSAHVFDWAALPPALDDEARLSRLTAWILAADAAGRPFSLRLPGAEIDIGRGPGHVHACCRLLALHGQVRVDHD